MLKLQDYRNSIESMSSNLDEMRVSLDIAGALAKIEENEKKMNEQDFWNNNELAQKVLQENKVLKETVGEFNTLKDSLEEIEVLIELGLEENDESIEKEIEESISNLEKEIDTLKIKTLLSGEYDKNNAILSINAGTGGLDAQDWAQMLLRMYIRWGEGKDYKVKVLDMLSDPAAGIKSATLLIEGINAYGYLKSEKGVHRIVRISPFDPSGKRHTSFASIDVLPELDESINIDINQADLKIDTYRASGAGGQHVNTTDSAVRITHIPTGVVVQCQNERSQHKNKDTAMRMLMAKLIELKELEQKEKIEDIQGKYSQITWGSQIRSYVFQPYKLVKDHRTNAEVGNVDSVMDGNIDLFINEYLKMNKSSK
ncbi:MULTISPECIES: peptide chain release factor 2 [unclassified Romboutsia]|uniref:peptide chain release factor 2 n=1 Tax=unclassified Romboutsia TaxID=2626894 RepID=UPI0018970C95|nr:MULTISPECIES: peptide chain release factor 2 [unclassified Romboutsia]MDB8805909.1 peptide chain release factor 2 [Romboutsia sp. 1001216sp1]MDB8808360.1 peptide chain release factor 2 [Romboutsia sp. 1001216sp1]MDB8811662.1 peptide chain release factor 2 [Romboutsia sp. 1001216sp1]MDB8817349.1 peptide chain release factor 2 [Romboutsia sp. 1001216sp1]MDB8819948.1 peptide chain release factor 2 [Romboutsia sp. 1001216sp1]